MIALTFRYRWLVLSLLGFFTLVFALGTILGLIGNHTQASMDPGGEVFNLQNKADALFPPQAHGIPFEVFSDDGTDVLTQPILFELLLKEREARSSELGKEFLIEFRDPQERLLGMGFFSIADALEAVLEHQDSSLAFATNQEVKLALNALFQEPHGTFFKSWLSQHARFQEGAWTSPAFYFFAVADNERLGGGVFRRTIGGDKVMLTKERLNRSLQEALQGQNYKLLGIGIDLNLQAEEQGYSLPILARIAGLAVLMSILGGLILHSWKAGLLVLMGLGSLFLWIRGFPFVTGGIVRPSLTTEVLLPLAFMGLGMDFVVHIGRGYRKERQSGHTGGRAFTVAFTALAPALFLATTTDAIAFAANTVSPVEAVMAFGIVGAFAAVASFFLMGVGIPLLLMMMEGEAPETRGDTQEANGLFLGITRFIMNHRVLCSILLVTISIGAGLSALRVERGLDVTDFFAEDSPLVESLNVRDQHFGDRRGEEVILFIEGDLHNPLVAAALNQVRQNLTKNRFLAHDPEGNLVLPYGEQIDERGRAMKIVAEAVNTRELQNVQQARLQLEQDLAPLAGLAEYGITGSPITRQASLESVTTSLISTAGVAAGVMFLLLLLVFRSFRLALITLIPMGMVELLTYGLMGAAGFHLNFITATIAAVALGLGIDYSVYIVQGFREERRHAQNAKEAMMNVASHTGWSVFLAALTGMIGFAVLATAPMPLFSTYGILATAMIGFSLICAMAILPIVLSIERR